LESSRSQRRGLTWSNLPKKNSGEKEKKIPNLTDSARTGVGKTESG